MLPELVFNASDVPGEIHYEFTTGSEKIDAETNFFLKTISDRLMQVDGDTQVWKPYQHWPVKN